MDDLRPCPFCGSKEIELSEFNDIVCDNGHWKIQCSKCPAEMSEAYLIGNYCKGDKPQMLAQIKNKWNRRYEVRRKTTQPEFRSKGYSCED